MQAPRVAASIAVLGLALLAACGTGTHPPSTTAGNRCDRACLEHHLDALLLAMLAHDPSRLALTADFRYVENNQALQAGDGSWRTLQSFGSYRHYFADPETGNAALITTMREADADGLFTARIRVAGGKLAEAETVLTHDPHGAASYTQLGKPAAAWLEAAPEDERSSREELVTAANSYFGAMENNDGKGDYSFFADDCNRLEHGVQTTNMAPHPYGHLADADFVTLGCRGQFETGLLGFVTRIRDRRYEVVDEERGVVFAIATLDHNDKLRNIPLTTGKELRLPAYFAAPRSLQVGEAFRIRDGRIHDIEMTLHEFPYGMPTGFRPTFDPSREVPGGRAPDRAKRCDASCLEALAEQLLKAMVAHDPKRAPLADQLVYTENDQRIELYDGLWGTLTEAGAYRLRVVEPARGSITLIARVAEGELAGMLGLRLQVRGTRITEIEATIVREQRAGADELFRVRPPFEASPAALVKPDPVFVAPVPAAQRTDVVRLATLVNQYFDAVQQGQGGDIPFTPDCLRRENGVVATGTARALDCAAQLDSGYPARIARIRDRRILGIDEERGLVAVAAWYDLPGAGGRPCSLDTLQVFRIDAGAIQRVEALAQVMPYGARPWWRTPAG